MAYIAPGMPAPKTGTYVLFDRYRVPTGVAVWREKGDPLPLVTVAGTDRCTTDASKTR